MATICSYSVIGMSLIIPYFALCGEEVGPDATHKFLGHTQWLVNYWLLQRGFSIGIGDTISDFATMEVINDTISKAKNEVKQIIKATQEKQLEAEPGHTMMESFENRVNQVLLNLLHIVLFSIIYYFLPLSGVCSFSNAGVEQGP